MRKSRLIIAVVLLLAGLVWIGQGTGTIAGSAMSGSSFWAIVGAVLVAFLLGSGAGSAVPVRAGLGSSEAAYVAVLTSVGVPDRRAIEEVLIFRVITFWLPAIVGLAATRYLFRRTAI